MKVPVDYIMMTFYNLYHEVKEKCFLNKQEAREVVNTFFNEIAIALANGDRVEIRGFCSFFIKEYEGYTGRNPKTGKSVQVPPKKAPFFRCGKNFNERVNYPLN